MRVNEHNLTGVAAAEAGRAQESQKLDRGGGARTTTYGSGGDRVELSSTLTSLSHAMESHHAERAARVQELAAQYQGGKYRTDAAATSRAMVGEALAPAVR